MAEQQKADARVSENMRLAALGVPLLDLLADYGIDIDAGRPDDAQQFSCPLHGDGKDERGSARYYPDSNTAKCWGCDKLYDPIEWVKSIEGCSFPEAVERLCRDYVGIEIDQQTKKPTRDEISGRSVIQTFEADCRRCWDLMEQKERVAISQTLDRLWAVGCDESSQEKIESFLTKIRGRKNTHPE